VCQDPSFWFILVPSFPRIDFGGEPQDDRGVGSDGTGAGILELTQVVLGIVDYREGRELGVTWENSRPTR
jgi:hypothetical protein